MGDLARVVDEALAAEPQQDNQDAAVAQLARRYAAAIDDGGDLTKLGPSLLTALEALHLSPRARAAAQRGMKTSGRAGAGKLDELRERRRRRGTGQHPAETGDAAAT